MAHSTFQSYISGKLLGDGSITMQNGRKPRFQFTHTITDYEWSNYCYKQLKEHIPLNPPTYRKIIDSRISKGFTESYIVQSKTHELITYLESIWYTNRRKNIPFTFLEDYLDEKALAWWYQDDGHLKVENGIPRKIVLSTDNFTHQENQQLIELLKRKFSLYFSIDSQNRLLLYDQPQIYYFYRLVEPYLHPSMCRKMLDLYNCSIIKAPKRTTLYLPSDITIQKPTSEINNRLVRLSELYKTLSNRNDYLAFCRKYMLGMNYLKKTKPYQISIQPEHLTFINKINRLTGLNNSQIALLCFDLS